MRFVALPKVLRLVHLAVRERARARTAGRRHRAAEPVVEAHGGVLRVPHPHECAQNIVCARVHACNGGNRYLPPQPKSPRPRDTGAAFYLRNQQQQRSHRQTPSPHATPREIMIWKLECAAPKKAEESRHTHRPWEKGSDVIRNVDRAAAVDRPPLAPILAPSSTYSCTLPPESDASAMRTYAALRCGTNDHEGRRDQGRAHLAKDRLCGLLRQGESRR